MWDGTEWGKTSHTSKMLTKGKTCDKLGTTTPSLSPTPLLTLKIMSTSLTVSHTPTLILLMTSVASKKTLTHKTSFIEILCAELWLEISVST
jgi:hypothetical protein